MSQALPRTNFNSSRLIRYLADLSPSDNVDSKQDVAERLGQWLDFADATLLFAALEPTTDNSSVAQSDARVINAGIELELSKVRTALMDSIKKSSSPNASEARIKFPVPEFATNIDIATAYAPFHRYYLTHQRDMNQRINPLRAKVRQVLTRTSPTLWQLAALDAAFDATLNDREHRLLSTVPIALEKRFEQLLITHQQMFTDTDLSDDPVVWMQPEGWLARFRNELQEVLLAELDIRLQPIVGLIEAFSHEINRRK